MVSRVIVALWCGGWASEGGGVRMGRFDGRRWCRDGLGLKVGSWFKENVHRKVGIYVFKPTPAPINQSTWFKGGKLV